MLTGVKALFYNLEERLCAKLQKQKIRQVELQTCLISLNYNTLGALPMFCELAICSLSRVTTEETQC